MVRKVSKGGAWSEEGQEVWRKLVGHVVCYCRESQRGQGKTNLAKALPCRIVKGAIKRDDLRDTESVTLKELNLLLS